MPHDIPFVLRKNMKIIHNDNCFPAEWTTDNTATIIKMEAGVVSCLGLPRIVLVPIHSFSVALKGFYGAQVNHNDDDDDGGGGSGVKGSDGEINMRLDVFRVNNASHRRPI